MTQTQFKQNGVKRRSVLKKIVKKHEKKELLTLERVKLMRDTPLNPKTLQKNARPYFATHRVGSILILSHPYTDVHGRYLKTVMLDFTNYENTGYVSVQPFLPRHDVNYGVTCTNYTFDITARSHRELYRKLLEHKLL